ncbi:tyrosine-protein phosphatase vhp-1 isoform X2 [Sander lucioperca]|uniref:tyrosine-protein phosphatase vhp-1 isoform X2 n=1 Tax=Sander lucioperca TaxID=283035 RepID=UPI001653EAFA|nr:tyrosine-protein phosphatase vhp-1 isoform X2 [Sander lucioperca]
MVWSRQSEAERPALSAILPRLYLGAESDVTQERLASLGISYVLSVSRCSPQPSFLPCSRYLRVPIDDSLRDELLPWIPQALRFIDAAMSSGASVLVHCAAGISRSPALAVAYIMYSLGMDLDHAYRFVKERRPSISPNFNFLGQLQHFQGTLCQKASGGDLHIQQLDNRLPSITDSVTHSPISQNMSHQADSGSSEAHTENWYDAEQRRQRHSQSDGSGQQQVSLSGELQTLHLTLTPIQQQIQTPCELPAPSPCEPVQPLAKPTQLQLQLPAGSASLLEKRKSLTLSLTPLGTCPPSAASSSQQARSTDTSQSVHQRETGQKAEAKTRCDSVPRRQAEDGRRERGDRGTVSPTSRLRTAAGSRVPTTAWGRSRACCRHSASPSTSCWAGGRGCCWGACLFTLLGWDSQHCPTGAEEA